MHDDQDIENEDLVNDEVAQQLASLQKTDPSDPQPGQQLQPDPDASDPVATKPQFEEVSTKPYTPPTDDSADGDIPSTNPVPQPATPTSSPTADDNQPESQDEEAPAPSPTPTVANSQSDDDQPVADDEELADIKKQALEELSPLVDKLDLPHEKRYDVLMEMIQSSDDKSLIDKAFEAAHKIDDDDLRAQALLEIVNEIDYLTNVGNDSKDD